MSDFKTIAKNCDWSEEIAVATFKAIVHPDIRRLIDNLKIIESIEKTLIKIKYPTNKRNF